MEPFDFLIGGGEDFPVAALESIKSTWPVCSAVLARRTEHTEIAGKVAEVDLAYEPLAKSGPKFCVAPDGDLMLGIDFVDHSDHAIDMAIAVISDISCNMVLFYRQCRSP